MKYDFSEYIRAIPLACRPDRRGHDVVIREPIAFEIGSGVGRGASGGRCGECSGAWFRDRVTSVSPVPIVLMAWPDVIRLSKFNSDAVPLLVVNCGSPLLCLAETAAQLLQIGLGESRHDRFEVDAVREWVADLAD